MAVLGYRIGLKGLSPRELDIAFSESLEKNQTSFRPTAGEIRGRLREARIELRAAELRALPEAPLSPEEAKQVLEDIQQRRASLPPSDIEIAKAAIKKAREELQIIRQETGPECVIELSEELLQKRESLKRQAFEWANRAGQKTVAETA
jgi:tRNA nucleotidyltransferase/poly(A) polymerase